MNRVNIQATLILLLLFGLASIALGGQNDLALYTGPTNPGWISPVAVAEIADLIKNDAGIKRIFKHIDDFGDGDEVGDDSPLAKWTKAHTGNGQQDVIVTVCGTTPSALYPFPNKKPDGSNVENFIEDGNVVINIADWIFYMSYEGGVRSADNGAAGAANVFDVPGLTFSNRGGPQKPTEAGKKYLPKSLKEFQSARPWHLEQLEKTDWEVTAFAKADDITADPAVAVNKKYGGIIAAMWQKDAPIWPGDDPRGPGIIEFITNWLPENAEGFMSVDVKEKLATTWGEIKSQ
ncbi:MAG: hypothetical protein ACE5K8_08420 [Candidatus Zixiibacteriota bacterium]